jgi:hypothetical protein
MKLDITNDMSRYTAQLVQVDHTMDVMSAAIRTDDNGVRHLSAANKQTWLMIVQAFLDVAQQVRPHLQNYAQSQCSTTAEAQLALDRMSQDIKQAKANIDFITNHLPD